MFAPDQRPIATGVPVSSSNFSSRGVPIATASGVPIATASGVPIATNGCAHVEPREVAAFRQPRNAALLNGTSINLPSGVPPGGQFVEATFFGPRSMFCCFMTFLFATPLACFVPCFPCDSTLLYRAPDGTFWDPDTGVLVGY
jgi:hypothetical protein